MILAIRTCKYSSIAQSVEHAAVNRGVVGSSPTGGAMRIAVTYGVAAISLKTPTRAFSSVG